MRRAYAKLIPVSLSEEELVQVQQFEGANLTCSPKHNLLIFLIESLETWALEYPANMPNMYAIMQRSNVLNIKHITSQALAGCSGDGQMIVNSGLLPIAFGVASELYYEHQYPSFVGCFDHSTVLNSSNLICWHKDKMMANYGYQEYIDSDENDEHLFTHLRERLRFDSLTDGKSCTLVLTLDTHSPFDRIPMTQTYDPAMPEIMQRYLNGMHFVDSCFGEWYREWLEKGEHENTVLVITGDHNIFKPGPVLESIMPYAQQAGLSMAAGQTYCPLIIQSPDIQENIVLDEVYYQMDIYPTILSAIGAEDYYWQGFGVNLLDSAARANRLVEEDEAYRLSDKLIRGNYFQR